MTRNLHCLHYTNGYKRNIITKILSIISACCDPIKKLLEMFMCTPHNGVVVKWVNMKTPAFASFSVNAFPRSGALVAPSQEKG